MNAMTDIRPFVPSPQQRAIFEWVKNGRGSAFVQAVAGAGKTTTLIEALKLTTGTVDFAAYNKKIADEIKAKVAKLGLGNRIHVGTFHSFGFSAWRKVYPKVEAGLDASRKKADMVARKLELDKPEQEGMRSFVEKLVSLAKQRALGLFGSIEDRSQWFAIVEHFDLAYEIEDPEQIEQGITLAIAAIKVHKELAPQIVDFDDMIYMPVITGVKVFRNRWVLVDEAQDTNPTRRALVRKMLWHDGRAMFVGDDRQAIYGFTGADADAIEQIKRDFRCTTLPLTVTYRCPKSVVRLAQEVVSHIEAHETAPEGEVSTIEEEVLWKVAEGKGGSGLSTGSFSAINDAILCRNTAPLVQLAYGLLRRGVACHVEGKDIGAGLLKLANRWAVRTLDQLRDKLEVFVEKETEKLVAKGRETQAEALRDRVDTLAIFIDQCKTVSELRAKIAAMFMDGENEAKPTLTLSTVHRAKGREWERVFLLGRNLYMPSPYARQEWQQLQEQNLIYVAYTRAKSQLHLVNVQPPAKS